jgi:hypothetical protein
MNINTGLLNFQVTPGQVQRDRLESRLYNDQNTRGPFFYGANLPSIRGLRGLGALGGAVDVTPLATAFLQGKINPSYSTLYAQLGYSQTPQALPAFVNADMATTQQVASLLSGSVVMAPAGNYQWANPATPTMVPWVQTSGGSFRVGDVFPPGVILSYQSLCDAATSIAASIPGGTVGSSCSGSGVTEGASQYQGTPAQTIPSDPTTPITSAGASQVTQIPMLSLMDSASGDDMTNGGTFAQGDQFQLVITNAAPNAPVTVTATHNGVPSTSVLGTTSAAGSFSTSGTMDASTAGTWVEQWQIPAGGGASALSRTVNFSVAAPASTISTKVPVTISAGDNSQLSSGDSDSNNSNVTPPATDNTTLYIGIAAAALLAFMMMEKR